MDGLGGLVPLSAWTLSSASVTLGRVDPEFMSSPESRMMPASVLRSVMPGPQTTTEEPWYHEGLAFTCTQCGKCCTGAPGYVWVNEEEQIALARFRGEPLREFTGLYTRPARGKVTLREKENGDCVFYDRDRGCTVYAVRPRQCRTWPFWESNLASPEAWQQTTEICPGSGTGELIPVDEILHRVKIIKM